MESSRLGNFKDTSERFLTNPALFSPTEKESPKNPKRSQLFATARPDGTESCVSFESLSKCQLNKEISFLPPLNRGGLPFAFNSWNFRQKNVANGHDKNLNYSASRSEKTSSKR